MTEAEELRSLDRELAPLMGWTPETFSDGVYWRDASDGLWSYLPNFSGCATLDPHIRWEGFGLLVEEAERRGWVYSQKRWRNGSRTARIEVGDRSFSAGSKRDIYHAFALAMRDALKAQQDAQG